MDNGKEVFRGTEVNESNLIIFFCFHMFEYF